MNEDLTQLKQDVEELKAWKAKKELQQISYPLDQTSINILGRYFLRVVNDLVLFFGGASGRGFEYLFAKQDNAGFQIQKDTSQLYTVDPTTDIFTVQDHGYLLDTKLYVFTTDTQPSPLVLGNTYFVVSPSGLTFKLSATLGGAAINITTSGVGLNFIDYAA